MTPEETAAYNKVVSELAAKDKKLAELQAVANEQTKKDFAPAFHITLDPSQGKAGTTVKVAGAGFGKEQGTSLVIFEGALVTPSAWSDTSLTVVAPSNVKTGTVVVAVGDKRGSATFTAL